jgi:succinate dehydrogenase/fumarate reductase flavoprotein subunit
VMHLKSRCGPHFEDRAELELTNLVTVAELMIISAMAREESRGAHYRSDFPCRNDKKFARHSVVFQSDHVEFVEPATPPEAPAGQTNQGAKR